MFNIKLKLYILLASIILNSKAIVYLVTNKALILSNFFINTNKEVVEASS